jgi:hypothetical protein
MKPDIRKGKNAQKNTTRKGKGKNRKPHAGVPPSVWDESDWEALL